MSNNNFTLKPLDTLSIFAKTDGLNKSIDIVEIPIEDLQHYKNHPFKLYTGQRFTDMVESIKENGLYSPIIARPLDNERNQYEILSGHNRYEASKMARFESIPCIIKKDLSVDEAYLIVTESNLLQRSFSDLTHSEKAVTLATHYETLKNQGKRTDLIKEIENCVLITDKPQNENENSTCTPVGNKLKNIDKTGDNYGLSKNTVARYLRINKLIDLFKEMLDNEKLSIRAGVILSYIPEQSQLLIANYIDENKLKIDIKKAEKLKELSQKEMTVTEKNIEEIFLGKENKKNPKTSNIIKIKAKRYERFFSENTSQTEIEETLEKALEFYFEHKNGLEQSVSEENEQNLTENKDYTNEHNSKDLDDLDDFDLFVETQQN